jgi:hypothetical protein
VRLGLIITLSSALFKSYFRSSSQRATVSFFSRPKVMIAIDIALFVFPAIALQFVVGALPADLSVALRPLVVQGIISLPLLMTSAVIVAGLMFELGQGSAISSSEAVNWWPVSSREYVAASSLSTSLLYSAFLAFSAGITLPLAIKFGLFYVWPVMMLLSIFSLLLGAFIVESLKAIMNRVSAAAYKKRGRLTLAVRLVALILLFSIIQMAFQPYVLSWFFGKIVAGIEVVWMVPFVWPSAAMVSLFGYNIAQTALYILLSILFTMALYESASRLRSKYWSPIPISISIDGSREYNPQATGTGFGFGSFASLLALKEFRALTRRKDLARFIAIPVMIAVSALAPVLASPGDISGRGPGFFLAVLIPLLIPLMFSTISIGQEGNSVMNLLCLPIKAIDLIKGKLAPAWLISVVATFMLIAGLEILAPLGLNNALATMVVAAMAIVVNSFIGLGVGARWPDYTVGARSRYISIKGFFVGFVLSGLATLAVYAPVALHIVTSGGVRGQVPFLGLDLLPMVAISIVLGCVLIVLSYIYCKKGVENLLSNAKGG